METNIFRGTKFGDKFITKDGQIAIYHGFFHNFHCLNVSEKSMHIKCFENGKSSFTNGSVGSNWADIVSPYQESVNEETFDYSGKMVSYAEQYAKDNFDADDVIDLYDIEEAYIAGFRKAKEE